MMKNKLIVMSSNIRFSTPHDGRHNWAHRLPLLEKTINSIAPHLLGTQEGRQPQILELSQKLSSLSIVDQNRDWITERMYPCLFYSSSQIQIENSGDIWLSETPYLPGSHSFESAFPRLCTWATVKLSFAQQKIMVVNVHLDHIKSETRLAQIKVLTRQITKLNSQNLPLILMGDFNEGPHEAVYQYIFSHWPHLYDPWTQLCRPEETSYHKFLGQLKEGKRIDWILLDQSLKASEIALDKGHVHGLYPSDHFPLYCEIIF